MIGPCIDAGHPDLGVGDEPVPDGGRINMEQYGGTEYASKSPVAGAGDGSPTAPGSRTAPTPLAASGVGSRPADAPRAYSSTVWPVSEDS